MQARQKLMVEFADYPHMLITNFQNCIKDPHKYECGRTQRSRDGGSISHILTVASNDAFLSPLPAAWPFSTFTATAADAWISSKTCNSNLLNFSPSTSCSHHPTSSSSTSEAREENTSERGRRREEFGAQCSRAYGRCDMFDTACVVSDHLPLLHHEGPLHT